MLAFQNSLWRLICLKQLQVDIQLVFYLPAHAAQQFSLETNHFVQLVLADLVELSQYHFS